MNDLTASLLWLGIEDYTGLWEAVAEVRSQSLDSAGVDAREKAETLIRDLADAGLIEIYLCREPVEDRTASLLPRSRYDELLADVSRWDLLPVGVPLDEMESVRFATTAAGIAAYNEFFGTSEVGMPRKENGDQ